MERTDASRARTRRSMRLALGMLLLAGCSAASEDDAADLDTLAAAADVACGDAGTPEPPADASTPSNPSLPAITDPAQPGPFRVQTVATAAGLSTHSLILPAELGRDGVKHPIVVWTNGNGGSTSFYRAFLEHLASHGFFVVADKRSTSNHELENREQVLGLE